MDFADFLTQSFLPPNDSLNGKIGSFHTVVIERWRVLWMGERVFSFHTPCSHTQTQNAIKPSSRRNDCITVLKRQPEKLTSNLEGANLHDNLLIQSRNRNKFRSCCAENKSHFPAGLTAGKLRETTTREGRWFRFGSFGVWLQADETNVITLEASYALPLGFPTGGSRFPRRIHWQI